MINDPIDNHNFEKNESQLDLSFEFIFKTTAKLCRAYTVGSDENLYTHDPISERVKDLTTESPTLNLGDVYEFDR